MWDLSCCFFNRGMTKVHSDPSAGFLFKWSTYALLCSLISSCVCPFENLIEEKTNHFIRCGIWKWRWHKPHTRTHTHKASLMIASFLQHTNLVALLRYVSRHQRSADFWPPALLKKNKQKKQKRHVGVDGRVLEVPSTLIAWSVASEGHTNAPPLPRAVSSLMHCCELPVSIDYRESAWIGSWIFSRSELR